MNILASLFGCNISEHKWKELGTTSSPQNTQSHKTTAAFLTNAVLTSSSNTTCATQDSREPPSSHHITFPHVPQTEAKATTSTQKTPTDQTKTWEATLQWGGHTYTVKQDLPETTTIDQWENIVQSYEKILKAQKDIPAGVNTLTLTLDPDDNSMKIETPQGRGSSEAKKQPIVIKSDTVNALVKLYADYKINILSSRLIPTKKADKTVPLDAIHTLTRPIRNTGNTCFIASVIQGWLIYQKAALEKQNNEGTQILLKLINDYETKESIDLQSFVDFLKKKKPAWFSDGILLTQDPQELIAFLREFMPNTAVQTYTEYTYKQEDSEDAVPSGATVVEETATKDPYSGMLTLHPTIEQTKIQSGQTFDQLVTQSFTQENKNIQLKREICVPREKNIEEVVTRELTVTSQKQVLTRAPEELMIQVGRFQVQSDDQKDFVGGAIENVSEKLTLSSDFFENKENPTYRLRSVIRHIPSSRHYVAYVRKFNKDGSSSFVKANDSTIQPVDTKTVLEEAGQGGYLLIYDKSN